MKISKRVREEAAQLCSMCACHGAALAIRDALERLGLSTQNQIGRIAVRAWDAANRTHVIAASGERITTVATLREDYAEAESLLRCGWSP